MRLVVVMTAVLGLTAGCVVEGQTPYDGSASDDASVLLDLGPVGDLKLRPDASDAASPTDAQRVSDLAVAEDAWVADYPGFVAVITNVPQGIWRETVINDANNDSVPDVIAVTETGVVTLFGKVSGELDLAHARFSKIDFGVGPLQDMNSADFNGDHNIDLVFGTRDGVAIVVLGDGAGGFTRAPGTNSAGKMYLAGALAVGDFNGDGKPDIAMPGLIENTTWNTIKMFVGNGDGTFQIGGVGPAPSCRQSASVLHIISGDFNGDGNADLAYSDEASGGGTVCGSNLAVVCGNGHLGWSDCGTYKVNQLSAVSLLTAARLQGKSGDALITNIQDPMRPKQPVLGIIQSPKATPVFVDLAVPFSGGDEAYAADLNGDGKMDVLTSNGSILLGNGDGTFQADRPIPMKPAYPIGAADFNHDGKADPVLVTDVKGYAGSFAVLLSHLP